MLYMLKFKLKKELETSEAMNEEPAGNRVNMMQPFAGTMYRIC